MPASTVMTTIVLPIALGIIMFGLGLNLTVADFTRVAKVPKAAFLALLTQIVILPVVTIGIIWALDLSPVLAVGMMLLAASPGGSTANILSHLAGGDVALNITLTAINSVLAIVTLPIVVNLAIDAYLGAGSEVGMQTGKLLQVFATVLIPVVIGMLVRKGNRAFADRMARPVRIASVVVLSIVIFGTLMSVRENIGEYFAAVGVATAIMVLLSLALGYYIPRLAKVGQPQAVASAFEVGIHNAALAIAVALTVIGNDQMAVPGAVYGFIMFIPAGALAWYLGRKQRAAAEQRQRVSATV